MTSHILETPKPKIDPAVEHPPQAHTAHTLRLDSRISLGYPRSRTIKRLVPARSSCFLRCASRDPAGSLIERPPKNQRVCRPHCRSRQWGLGPWRRSVCAPFVLGEGVQLRVECLRPCYVRAKNLKWATTTLRYSRFETRFFASFLFAFEKK